VRRTRIAVGTGALAMVVAGAVLLRATSHPSSIVSTSRGLADLAPTPGRPNDTGANGSTKALFVPAASSSPLDETALMTRMRSAETTAPDVALQLAREGNLRFPGSSDAAERAAAVVRCLAQLGRVSEARGEAEIMVNRYAGTPWALEVERHTGAHPHRNR